MMNVSVVGCGYVGLVTGACFAEFGNNVSCVDIDEEKIMRLKSGDMPIYEPGLEELVKRNCSDNRLYFYSQSKEKEQLNLAIKKSEIIFICVGTPSNEDGSANLGYVHNAVSDVFGLIEKYTIIAIKSTVPVGTADALSNIYANCGNIEFVSNPEFLKEGNAVEDFMKPDRIIIGAKSEKANEVMGRLYEQFVRTGKPILTISSKSAELTKYASNAMLATRISFINEIANLCELVGANIDDVRKGIGSDPRIGPSFLFPGLGYGGSCFPKDTRALIYTGKEKGYSMDILKAVDTVNTAQREKFFKKIKDHFGMLEDKTIAIWGLAFKPKTDDLREAPSIPLINFLLDSGTKIRVFDPNENARMNAQKILKETVSYYSDMYDILKDADALAIATEWGEFRSPDFLRMLSLMHEKVIFDGRNIYDPERMRQFGFKYFSVGRP